VGGEVLVTDLYEILLSDLGDVLAA
jgi:hypothetical protein